MPTATEPVKRTALVLASSGGLGRASAEALSAAGRTVIMHSRGGGKLKQAASGFDAVVGAYAWDLGKPGATATGIRRIVEDGHRPTILICNCGGPPPGDVETLSRNQWDAAYQSILMSALEATTTLLPVMREEGWGRIVLISSITACEPLPELALSSVFRAGLWAMVKCVAVRTAIDGITINAVLSGYALTDRLKSFEGQLTSIKEAIPMKRFADPAEVAAVVAFLASDKASYVTGQSVLCDGGLVRGLA